MPPKEDLLEVELSSQENSSIHGPDSSRGHHTTSTEEEKNLRDAIIKKEEMNVRKAKILVMGAVLTCAVTLSAFVYRFAKQSDEHFFEIEVSKATLSLWSRLG